MDLIERQAAIAYAISGRVRTLPTTEDGENWIRVSEVRESLIMVPSAQPDTYEALRILDAINSSGRLDYGDYCDLHDAISEIGGAQNG